MAILEMTPEQHRLLLEETMRRAVLQSSVPDIFDPNFPQQKAFIKDPSNLKALFCTRRSAKSYTAGLYLVYEAMNNPGCNCLFVGLTRDSAKRIIWKDILSEINYRFALGMEPNQTDLTMTLPNGSVIKVTGIDADENEMKKLLGAKYRLVCIDEASMYTVDIHNVVYGILRPAMVDPNAGGQRGTICLMGTASNFPRGLFYKVTTNAEPGWSLHQWSAHDNPYVATQWQEELDEIAALRPLYMETPQFKQFYLNQWVIDEEKLVYRFNPQRNLAKGLPQLPHNGWVYTLGIDLGWEDDNAFVLSAYHHNDPKKTLYIVDSRSKKKMTFDEVGQKVLEYQNSKDQAPSKIIIDGANKQGVESMRARSNIPFEYADKQDKATYIELFNSDLIQGKVQVIDTPQNRPLWEEMCALVWMTDGEKIKFPKKEHPNLPNHRCDALLYNWRCGYHYQSEPAQPKIIVGSKAWYQQQAEDIWEKERERLEAVEEKPLWPEETGGW